MCYSVIEKDELKIRFFRYCGEYYDSEIEQIYLRARYYDPSLGRFTQSDPAMSGANWYVYCSNNPILSVDPSGLDHYILYDGDHVEDNEALLKQLQEEDPDTAVHTIFVDSIESFGNGWESMGGENGEIPIETVYILIHGEPQGLVTPDLQEYVDEKSIVPSELLSSPERRKTIDTIFLSSCNSGLFETDVKPSMTSVAMQFLQTQNVKQVIAPDGYQLSDIVNGKVTSTGVEHDSGQGDPIYSTNKTNGYCVYLQAGNKIIVGTHLDYFLKEDMIRFRRKNMTYYDLVQRGRKFGAFQRYLYDEEE